MNEARGIPITFSFSTLALHKPLASPEPDTIYTRLAFWENFTA